MTRSEFRTPPGWPLPPPGWTPPIGWEPNPAWGPAPDGWDFWAPEVKSDVDEHVVRSSRPLAPMPLSAGDLLSTVMMSPPVLGLVQTWNGSPQLWAIPSDGQAEVIIGRGGLARTEVEPGRFREVGALGGDGKLVLVPRFAATDGGVVSATTITLRPADNLPEDMAAAWNSFAAWLGEVAISAAERGEILVVERGGWEHAPDPFAFFIVSKDEDGTLRSHLEAAPAPGSTQLPWARASFGVGSATLSAPADRDTVAAAGMGIALAVAEWATSPWDVCVTFGKNPIGPVTLTRPDASLSSHSQILGEEELRRLEDAIEGLPEVFEPGELAWLCSTGKPELAIRDRLAWAMRKANGGSEGVGGRTVRREYRSPGSGPLDLVVTSSAGVHLVGEHKVCFGFDAVKNDAAWLRLQLSTDSDKVRALTPPMATGYLLLFAIHPLAVPDPIAAIEWPASYLADFRRLLKERSPAEYRDDANIKLEALLASHGSVVHRGTHSLGHGVGVDIDLSWWVVIVV